MKAGTITAKLRNAVQVSGYEISHDGTLTSAYKCRAYYLKNHDGTDYNFIYQFD
jgi:hypothetical protein